MNKILLLYRYLRGFITIRISGGFPERFLNLCNRERIQIFDSFYENGSVSAKIFCKDFPRLRKLRRKSGVKIKITDKCAAAYFFRKNRKRNILIYGMLFSVLFMSVMNLFVWCIDAKDTHSISKEEIIDAGINSGLKFGTFVPLYDENKANRDIVNMFNGRVIWSSVNIKGSKATFDIREYNEPEKSDKREAEPCNVIADFDAIIISADIYSGVSYISEGNAVKSGDLLISGIYQNNDGSVSFHNADGKITALHKTEMNKTYSKNEDVFTINEGANSVELKFFTLSIPLSPEAFGNKDCNVGYTELLKNQDCLLPFGFTHQCELVRNEKKISDLSPLFYIDEFTDEEYHALKNSLIIDVKYSFRVNEDSYNISAYYDCLDFIGKKSVILQEN